MKTIKDKYKRILEVSDDHKQITLPDSRYYRRNGKYYPSVTHVLSSYPKGIHYEKWLKQVGFSSNYLVKKAAEEGNIVHNLIEEYLLGKEIKFFNPYDKPKMEPHVWQMFLNFVDFWNTHKPKLIKTEVHLFSDKYKVAGTCDLVCEIDGDLWIIDHKTSNQLQTVYELQAAIYSQCWEECYGSTPDRIGILWLKSKSRGPDKLNKVIKGKNWLLHESKRSQEENIKIFKAVKTIFDIENPKPKPKSQTFPTIIKKGN